MFFYICLMEAKEALQAKKIQATYCKKANNQLKKFWDKANAEQKKKLCVALQMYPTGVEYYATEIRDNVEKYQTIIEAIETLNS